MRNKDKKINENIQVLRGVAILMVIVCHFPFVYDKTWFVALFKIFDFAVGVDLFFLISGYLMMGTYFGITTTIDAEAAFEFYRKRFQRILIPVLFWAGFCLIFGGVLLQVGLVPNAQELFWIFLSAASFTSNIKDSVHSTGLGYFWSIALEVQFYLVLPLIFYWGKKAALLVMSLSIIVMLILLSQWAWGWHFRMFGLLIGSLLWFFINSLPNKKPIFSTFTSVIIIPVYSLLLLLAGSAASLYVGGIYGQLIATLVFVFVLGTAILSDRVIFPLISRPLVWLGEISFSLYLCHIPVWGVVLWLTRDQLHLQREIYTGGALFASLFCAYYSRKYLELYNPWKIKTVEYNQAN